MLDPAVFIREPLTFKNKIKIYPPSVREVVTNPNFNIYYKLLTLTEDDVREEIGDRLGEGEKYPTPFEYLLLNCQFVNGFSLILQKSLNYFCHAEANFLFEQKCIVFNGEENITITENDFFEFQNAIRAVVGDKPLQPPEPINPNEDPRIRRIKEKARERDRIKAKQGAKNGISFTTCLVAICCMGIGITPLNIGEMSYASVGIIMKMMQEKEKYDIDIRSLLAGADSKKVKPKYWIRNTNE